MIKEKFRVLKGKLCLHFAFLPFALLPTLAKMQRANPFNFWLPFKTLNFSLPHTAGLSNYLINRKIKVGRLRRPTIMNNNNYNVLVLQTDMIILNNEQFDN